jgi:hydroxyacylglutathione hydrolase
MKIADGIFGYLWSDPVRNNCSMYYLGSPFNILVDPGYSVYLDDRVRLLAEDGITISDIRGVVCTHGHPDHFEGTIYFRQRGIPVWVHPRELDFMRALHRQVNGDAPNPHLWGAGLELLDDDAESRGVMMPEVFHTPGHSPGSICLYWRERGILLTGDLVFHRGVGMIGIPGGNGAERKESVRRMAELPCDLLLPGHGPLVEGAENVKKNFSLMENYLSMV